MMPVITVGPHVSFHLGEDRIYSGKWCVSHVTVQQKGCHSDEPWDTFHGFFKYAINNKGFA